MRHSSTKNDDHGGILARLNAARATVAALVVEDAIYAPIFTRLEIEIAAEEAKNTARDPVSRARAIAAAHALTNDPR